MGLLLLGDTALAAGPSSKASPRRVTPQGALFSIEFPAAPTCETKEGVTDCHASPPSDEWFLRTTHSKVELSGSPAEHLQRHLRDVAQEGEFEIDHQQAAQADGFPALDYRLESASGSAYRSAGRLVLIGTQLVDVEVGAEGDALPSNEAIQRIVNGFRVEGAPVPPQSARQEAVAHTAPGPQPVPDSASVPRPTEPEPVPQKAPEAAVAQKAPAASEPISQTAQTVQTAQKTPVTPEPQPQAVQAVQKAPAVTRPEAAPLLPSITGLFQAPLLKKGSFQYQLIQEKASGDGMPWGYSVGKVKRVTQRKRDKKRDAFVIVETGSTQAGRFENRYWVDAKTLLPYRWLSKSPGASMKLEVIDGFLRGERKGPHAAKFDQPVGNMPLLFPGAPLELAVTTLPLAQGFTGSVQLLELEGLATGKPFSTWQLAVPFAGPVSGLGLFKKDVAARKVELVERTQDKDARKSSLWIEGDKALRLLQVETQEALSRGGGRSVQTIQAPR